MNIFGALFAGTVLVLNLLLPLTKTKNFNYWFERGLNSSSSSEQIDCYTEAINSWKDSIGVEKKSEAFYGRGFAYTSKNLFDEAIADYDIAISLNPKYAEAYAGRGNVYYRRGMSNKAVDDYTKAIELKPDFAGAYNNRGVAYDDAGLFDKAISDYTRAILLKPGYANAYHNRGITYYKKGEEEEAKIDFAKAKENGYIYLQNITDADQLLK